MQATNHGYYMAIQIQIQTSNYLLYNTYSITQLSWIVVCTNICVNNTVIQL